MCIPASPIKSRQSVASNALSSLQRTTICRSWPATWNRWTASANLPLAPNTPCFLLALPSSTASQRVWLSRSLQWYHTPHSHREDSVDIDAFKQMVAKNPKGFLGRYGLGNKLVQEGGSLEEAVEHLTVATQLDPTHVASHLTLGRVLVSLERKDEAKPILQAGIDAARSGRSNGGGDLVPEMEALLRSLG